MNVPFAVPYRPISPEAGEAAPIVGATSVAQLVENIAAAQHELDAETLAAIAGVHARHPSAIA